MLLVEGGASDDGGGARSVPRSEAGSGDAGDKDEAPSPQVISLFFFCVAACRDFDGCSCPFACSQLLYPSTKQTEPRGTTLVHRSLLRVTAPEFGYFMKASVSDQMN